MLLSAHSMYFRDFAVVIKSAIGHFSDKIRNKRSGLLFNILFHHSLRRVASKADYVRSKAVRNGQNIAALTYRPNRGATGGPGGVLWLQKALLGQEFRGYTIDYHFRDNHAYLDWYAEIASGANFALGICQTGRYGRYYTHDLGCAYGLALAGETYVLHWHFQGSFVTQMLNFGHDLQPSLIETLQNIESVAMKSAKLVVFPSDGAKKMYFADNHCGCRTQDVELGPIIYNTILPKNSKPDVNHASIDIFEGLTFTSVGTLTLAKGQDQILDFFERMLPLLPNRVRWVCIGDGPLRGEILVRGDQLSKKFTNFEFKYLPRLPHKAVMNVLKLTDIYIMLHRISVFDFATLEAMSNNCAILLSKVGGNLDFDKEHNVIFMEEIDIKEMGVFSHENISRLKNINSAVLARHFSVDRFRESNFEVISRLASDTLQ